MSNKTLRKQPFAEHLAELRSRLLFVVVDFFLGSLIGYLLANKLIIWLLFPLHQSVYYTSPIGGFNIVISVSLFAGIIFTIPTFLYQSVLFSKPLLSSSLVRKMPLVIITSFILLIAGICFAYFIALPASLHFFSSFSTKNVKSLISATDYLTFVTKYFIGFGLLFQLPLVLLLINAATPLSYRKLLSFQRYIIVIAFIFGAILSPDPFTMCLMTVPLILLFYISVIIVWITNTRRKRNEKLI